MIEHNPWVNMLGALELVLKEVSASGVMFPARSAVKLFSDHLLFIMNGAQLSAVGEAVSAAAAEEAQLSIFDRFYIRTPSADKPVPHFGSLPSLVLSVRRRHAIV